MRNPLRGLHSVCHISGLHSVYHIFEFISSWTETKLRSILKYFATVLTMWYFLFIFFLNQILQFKMDVTQMYKSEIAVVY